MRDDTVKLITEIYAENDYGVLGPSRTSRTIYATVDSVSQSEWFQGGRNGLNPEFKVTTFSGNYNGEEVAEYKGRLYSIYRTYQPHPDTIELYLERRKGKEPKAPQTGD